MSDLSELIKKIITDEFKEFGWTVQPDLARGVAEVISTEVEALYGSPVSIYVEDDQDTDVLDELQNHHERISVLEDAVAELSKNKKRIVAKKSKYSADKAYDSLAESLGVDEMEKLHEDFSKFADEKGLYGTEPITSIPAAFRPVLGTSKVINRDLENVTLPTVATKWCSECMNDFHNYPDCPPLPKEI